MGQGWQGRKASLPGTGPARGWELGIPNPRLKLMDALREVLRVKHYATWIERVLARFGSLNPESALSLQPAPRPASGRSQICQPLSRGTESGRGLPQSKTLCEFGRMGARASVLECGCLLPLSFHWRAKGTSGEERLGSSRGD